MERSGLVRALLLVGFLLAATACGGGGQGGGSKAGGEDYPSEDIRLIVQAQAGGTSDLVARTAAGIAEEELGTSIVVENRPGASGSIAMQYVAAQPPDGYTLAFLPVEVSMLEYLGYPVRPDNFAMVSQTNSVPATLTVRADSPYETFEDFIAAAEERPGELTVGNSGPGSIWDAARGAIQQETGFETSGVPFDGGAPAVAALVGGDIDAVSVAVGEVLPNVESGELRVLAVLDEERSPQLSDVPTARELGYDLQILAWGGIGAPADTPEEVVNTLAGAFETVVASEEFRQTLESSGNQPVYKGPEEFTEYARSQSDQFSEIIPALEISQ